MAISIKQRSEIPSEFKWRLEDIFPSDAEWESEFRIIEKKMASAGDYSGHLGEGATVVKSCLEWMDDINERLESVYAYARMRRDEDNRNSQYQGMTDRAGSLAVNVGSALSFVVPELLSLPQGTLKSYVEAPELQPLSHILHDIIRKKEHILSPAEEKLLAQVGEIAVGPSSIFTMANNADLKFPAITDENGEEIELTKGNFIRFMESKNREVRKEAFKTLYSTYQKQRNTWAATLNSSIKGDVFFARARKYETALGASLDDDRVPVSVYNSLIKTVREFLPVMYRYANIRKRALRLEELHMYDVYVPIVAEVDMKIPYDEAKAIVLEGLKPLGEEYLNVLGESFRNSWIDIYENEGKTSGAYSWGTYRSHPYVLLNHQDTLDSTFTLAHEMGHALHTYFSNRKQPHIYAGYKIFVAEVASTLNEALVMEHLLKTTIDSNVKAYLINHYLEQFRGTVFRQTMFAEFEKIVHEAVENGEALTADDFSRIYRQLNQDYYGPDMIIDDEISLEWARIPHFYSAFYVYKYATGFSAAVALSRQILKEKEPAVARYLNFLSSGSSDYPIELLRQAGVDMEKAEPIRDALMVFENLVNQLETMLV